MSKHTLVATVEEGPATLNRVLSLFRQRSFAIESLSIGRTNETGIMRLTMVVDGAKSAVEQVTKQLYKVVEVRKVSDLSEDPRVERELALVKVSCKTAPVCQSGNSSPTRGSRAMFPSVWNMRLPE